MFAKQDIQSSGQLRQMGEAELARMGEESLRSHLVDLAMVAHQKYAPFDHNQINSLLRDPIQVRYPVKLVFEFGSLAPHQFAHVEKFQSDYRLIVHPALRDRDRDFFHAVAYFIPTINYGDLVDDELCLLYGATLSGITADAYYSELCRLADELGLIARVRFSKGDRF